MSKKKALISLLIISGILGLVSCRLDYGADVEAESLSDQVPDIEVTSFRQKIYQDNSLLLSLEADHSRSFGGRNLRELEGVRFYEYSLRGEVVSSGSADSAILFTDTDNVELSGNIEVYSAQEEARVAGQYFYWNGDERIITGLSEQMVTVITDDGDRIEGRGFSADLSKKSIKFDGGVTGEVEAEDSEDAE